MSEPFSSLTLYRLRNQLNGSLVTKLDDYIDPEKQAKAYDLRDPKDAFDFEARLFVAAPQIGPPAWLEPLKEGFSGLTVPDSVSNNAVLIIKVKTGKRAIHFASTFGFGRFLLRSDSFERNYGLRVAINAIYGRQAGDVDLKRVRSVDSKTVAANVLRTRRQVDRKADFESFSIDTQRDLLSGLTGTPGETDAWGMRIDGSDAVHLHRPVAFDQLGKICLQVEDNSDEVPGEFSWIDNIFPVRDAALLATLKERIAERVRSGETGNLELAPPELVEWGDLDHFAFSFDSKQPFAEPGLQEYVSRLKAKGKLESLTLNQLTSGHRLLAFDGGGQEVGAWPVFRCLSGEIEYKSKNFVLSEGELFEVARGYLAGLDEAINQLPDFAEGLPPSEPEYSEGDYNDHTAKTKKYLLLDKKTVKLTSSTTAIEICDMLSPGGALIHVKKKLGSSALSHLFSQAVVSADLLLMSAEFRAKARQRIAALTKQPGNQAFAKLFPAGEDISPSKFTVVYAIIADWNGRTLARALPFFSRVNLRRCVQDLKRMGYHVAYSQIAVGAAEARRPARLALVPPSRRVAAQQSGKPRPAGVRATAARGRREPHGAA